MLQFRRVILWMKRHGEVTIPTLVGSLIRIFYTFQTTYRQRTYDVDGHLEYIRWIGREFMLPRTGSMWEAHQGPLYYVISAIISGIGHGMGIQDSIVIRLLQWESCVYGIVLLIVTAAIALVLFPKKEHRFHRMLFCLLLASFPFLVFLSGRISNDTLSTLLVWVFTYLLLSWWRSGSAQTWMLMAVVSGFTILTKHNGYLLPLIMMSALIVRPQCTSRIFLDRAVELCCIVAAISGWFVVNRVADGYMTKGLFHYSGMEGVDLPVPSSMRNFFTFNPWDIIVQPFNSSSRPGYSREFFLQYLFKSIFVGEWHYEKQFLYTLRSIVTIGLGLLVMSVLGMLRMARNRASFFMPLFLLLLWHAGGLMVYRILHPCACNQDMRFIPIAVLPWAAFIVTMLPRSRMLRNVYASTIILFCGLCIIFLTALSLQVSIV
jgi:hypothetical protein